MNTPNPLIPQGSLEAQQLQKRSTTKLVVSIILGLHGIVLGGLLFLGCSKDDPEETQTEPASSFSSIAAITNEPTFSDPFGDILPGGVGDPGALGSATNPPSAWPPLPGDTNGFESAFSARSSNPPGFTSPSALPPAFQPLDEPPARTPLIEPTPEREDEEYIVLPNDNFWTIARKHRVKASDIAAANPGVDSRRLKVGQVLNLPANVKPSTPPVPEGGPASAAANEVTYTVKSGDNLSKIARTYGVTVKAIQQANGIRGSLIKVGQELVIPVQTGSESGR